MKIDNKSILYYKTDINKMIDFTMPPLLREILEKRRFLPRGKKIDLRINLRPPFMGDMKDFPFGEYGLVAHLHSEGFKFIITIYEPSLFFEYPIRESAENHVRIPHSNDTGDYINTLMLSADEALVHGMAHELRHMWQDLTEQIWNDLDIQESDGLEKHPGSGSDYDADRYATRKMREWRRLHAVDIYPEQPDLT